MTANIYIVYFLFFFSISIFIEIMWYWGVKRCTGEFNPTQAEPSSPDTYFGPTTQSHLKLFYVLFLAYPKESTVALPRFAPPARDYIHQYEIWPACNI